MNAEIMKVYVGAVSARVKANGHSSWGGDDSVAVIEQLCDAAYSSDEGFDAVREPVGELVNPSAFRQKLEKLPDGTAGLDKEFIGPDGGILPASPLHVKRNPTKGKRSAQSGIANAMAAMAQAGITIPA